MRSRKMHRAGYFVDVDASVKIGAHEVNRGSDSCLANHVLRAG
jgi:hypothetical protein